MADPFTTEQLEAVAFTLENLAAIRSAMVRGELTVQFADRAVTYRSAAELVKLEERIIRSLSGRPKQSLIVAGKGF